MSHRVATVLALLYLVLISSARAAEPPAAPPAAPPPAPSPGASAAVGVSGSTSTGASADTTAGVTESQQPQVADETPAEPESRLSRVQNSLHAASGLLHVVAADSDDVGTFRFSVIGSYFAGSEFLCPNCELADGTIRTSADDVVQVGTRLGLSFTPVQFLEGYAGLRFQTTENDQGDPTVVHIVGDSLLGAKAFLPKETDRLYGFGGSADLLLTNQPGGVGIDAASVRLRALGTLDLDDRSSEDDRIPLRAHLNVSYLFDNSGALADSIESRREQVLGGVQTLTRIERFGHDINRVDTLGVGIGAEAPLGLLQPFAEWSIDLPINRGDYTCNLAARSAGDACLDSEGFSAVPSRITLGARAYPWFENWTRGLAALVAFDIGTGATSTFTEELAPETPWMFHVGLGYGFDTEPQVRVEKVEKIVETPPPPERRIMGQVIEAGSQQPIAGASVRFAGQDITGMVTTSEGRFDSGRLEPGPYEFVVSADGFAEGRCTVELPTVGEDAKKDVTAWVECPLEALPDTANLEGVVRDAATTVPIQAAAVEIVDPLGRSLTLQTDDQGAFRFENVKAGESKVTISADGYLPTTVEYSIEPRKDKQVRVSLNPKPKRANVVVTDKELKIKEQIQFMHGSAEIVGDSQALIQEIAQTLKEHPEIRRVEVQGHTDDTGTPEYNQGLSGRRAEAVRGALVRNGVEESRLTAKGYGQDAPLVPNTSEWNKARNRRVQFVILERE